MLDVRNLSVSIEGKHIVNNVSFEVPSGKLHVIMGPNGSGKSTLAMGLAGHPKFEVTGAASLDGINLLELSPDERSRNGLFVSFQNPPEIPGVRLFNLLKMRAELSNKNVDVYELKSQLNQLASTVGLSADHLNRGLNVGFSGGERKRFELLQALAIKPSVAIFDEIDSGLDIDGFKLVVSVVSSLLNYGTSVILITHYKRILDFLMPDKVHIMKNGSFVKSGGADLISLVHESGFDAVG